MKNTLINLLKSPIVIEICDNVFGAVLHLKKGWDIGCLILLWGSVL